MLKLWKRKELVLNLVKLNKLKKRKELVLTETYENATGNRATKREMAFWSAGAESKMRMETKNTMNKSWN